MKLIQMITVKGLLFIAVAVLPASLNPAAAQEAQVVAAIREFHQALVKKDTASIDRLTHAGLSYGHSNGWIETKKDLLKNNSSRYMDYHSFADDSMQVIVSGNVACARFVADINSNIAGTPPESKRRKVLEIWILEKKQWIIFARQAIR
jgi:hypothetical protein